MEQSHTSFSVSGADDPFAQLLQQVKDAAEGIYDVLGEIGRSSSGNVVYLARELESGHLLALKLIRAPTRGAGEFDLNVVRTLDATVPGLENRCPECSMVLPDWERFCFHCGADLMTGAFIPSDDEANALLAAVREATIGQYDIVGKMDRSDGGGMVFFARDLARGRIVALRLKKDSSGEEESYSIGETQVLRPLAAELAATQMAPPAMREAMRAPPPLPPTPPAAAPAAPIQPDYLAAVPGNRSRRTWLIGGSALALAAVIAVVVLTSDSESIDTLAPAAPAPAPSTPPAPDTTTVAVTPPPPAATPAIPDSGVVVVVGTLPQGARVTIDGRTVRRWPVRLLPGAHQVALTAPGYEALRERVQVAANDTLHWRPALVAQQVAPAPAPTPTQTQTTPPAPAARATCARAAARSDWEQAASLCSAEAEAGGAEAQRIYGELLAAGHGVPANASQAATWFSKAATAGDREAQLQMGLMYRAGTGVRRDDKRAAEWFRQAAEGGSPTGMMEYAVMLDGGRGVSRSDVEAAQWFRKASDAGNAIATRRLGRLYERGEGVPKSETEAATLYRRAADKGDAEAQYQLGRYYKDGRGGLTRSDASAAEWFRKAAAQQHPAARDELRKIGGD